jgi:hypothetical protein
MKLDVFNGGTKNNMTHLEPDQDVSGQLWRFRGNADGTFRLSASFRGPSMCLVQTTTNHILPDALISRVSYGC